MPLMNLEDALKVAKEIFEEARDLEVKDGGVQIGCDEYHAHSALDGCLSGDKNLKNVCKMGETIRMLEGRFQAIKDLFVDLEVEATMDFYPTKGTGAKFAPWTEFEESSLTRLPIIDSPCKQCIHWAPRRDISVDAKGEEHYEGITLCHTIDMYKDFSCFSPVTED